MKYDKYVNYLLWNSWCIVIINYDFISIPIFHHVKNSYKIRVVARFTVRWRANARDPSPNSSQNMFNKFKK